MIIHNNEELIKAVESSGDSKIKIAVNADASLQTLEKMLAGETDMQLSAIDRIASHIGLRTVVSYEPDPAS